MESMLKQKLEVHSGKNNIDGVVLDYGFVTKLQFSWQGKEIEIGLKYSPLEKEPLEEKAAAVMDSYVEHMASDGKQIMLHWWYLEMHLSHTGREYPVGWGIVTGHPRISDATEIHTSEVCGIRKEGDEIVLLTRNNEYHCPLMYCLFAKMEDHSELLPGFDELREEYQGKWLQPTIEPGNVLLVLADFDEYYFDSLYYIPSDSATGERMDYTGWPHVGTYQDSYLIETDDNKIDLRYFPHFQNIEFYMEVTDDCPLWLENIGRSTIYANTRVGLIRLDPGDRKLVDNSNIETEKPVLPSGDLYPAGVIE